MMISRKMRVLEKMVRLQFYNGHHFFYDLYFLKNHHYRMNLFWFSISPQDLSSLMKTATVLTVLVHKNV